MVDSISGMRRIVAIGILLFLPLVHASAERFQSYDERTREPPLKYSTIQDDITAEQSNIDAVQCGGFELNGSARLQARQDNIALTTMDSAPGRGNYDPFGNLRSALGIRDKIRVGQKPVPFPEHAYGYASACSVYDTNFNKPPPRLCLIGENTANPQQCREFYDKLTARRDAQVREKVCGGMELMTCLDFTHICHGEECRCLHLRCKVPGGSFGGPMDAQALIAAGVCVDVTPGYAQLPNDECGASFVVTEINCALGYIEYDAWVAPFYRHYILKPEEEGDFPRNIDTIGGFDVVAEGQMQNVAADCYEFYREKDTLAKASFDWEKRCEMYETAKSDKYPPEWKPPLRQKASTAPSWTGSALNPERKKQKINPPWIMDDATSLQLINVEKLKELNKGKPDDLEIADFVPVIGSAERIASDTFGRARADDFDDATNSGDEESQDAGPITSAEYFEEHPEEQGDTAMYREISKWWDRQQQSLLEITRPPAARVILPATWATGFDPHDSVMALAGSGVTRSDGSVEIELRAGVDQLGAFIKSLSDSFVLPVREVHIPIVVPLISEAELDAVIHLWKQWEVLHHADGQAADIIAKLEKYKTQVREVRLLRTTLPSSLEKIFNEQQKVRSFFENWYQRNASALASWSSDEAQRTAVRNAWRDVQKEFIHLHDDCELMWCSNARYTTPVFTLLDGWLFVKTPEDPARGKLDVLSQNDDYILIPQGVVSQWNTPDVVADFSDLRIPKGGVELPVLDVTQVRVKLPVPPVKGGVPDVALFPDVPTIKRDDIPDILKTDAPPEVRVPTDALSIPGASSRKNALNDVTEKLNAIREMIVQAGDVYCEFRDSMKGGPPHKGRSREEADRKIAHTEFDLRERVERMFARRMPLVAQDYQGRAQRLGSDTPTCINDVICIPLPNVRVMKFTWQIIQTGKNPSYDAIANKVRDATLPPDEEHNPYFSAPIDVLKRIFSPLPPGKNRTDLTLPMPSSSSSSTPAAPQGPGPAINNS
jgi:hypothetical protein